MLLLLLAIAFAQDCPGDCDADGWTVADGDCNDGDPAINPGEIESCDNTVDDDCNRFVNDGCARDDQLGELGGGAACASEEAPVAGLLFLPLFLFRRR